MLFLLVQTDKPVITMAMTENLQKFCMLKSEKTCSAEEKEMNKKKKKISSIKESYFQVVI